MPRPTSKAELLSLAAQTWEALQKELLPLTEADLTAPGLVGDWSAKDVMAHLLAWHQMVLAWYQAGKAGGNPATPSEKYTWQELPALNQEIYEQHQDWPLAQVQTALGAYFISASSSHYDWARKEIRRGRKAQKA